MLAQGFAFFLKQINPNQKMIGPKSSCYFYRIHHEVYYILL